MLWRNLTLTAAIVCFGFASAAAAQDDHQEGLYAGLAIEQFRLVADGNFDGQDLTARSRPLGLTTRVGWNLLPWLGLEGFVSIGIHDDPNSGSFAGGGDVRSGETELKNAYGLAAKPRYNMTFGRSTTITLYALVGYSAYEYAGRLTADNALGPPRTAEFSIDDSGEYYGGGLQLEGEPGAISLQYVQYADEDKHRINAWQFGAIKYF